MASIGDSSRAHADLCFKTTLKSGHIRAQHDVQVSDTGKKLQRKCSRAGFQTTESLRTGVTSFVLLRSSRFRYQSNPRGSLVFYIKWPMHTRRRKNIESNCHEERIRKEEAAWVTGMELLRFLWAQIDMGEVVWFHGDGAVLLKLQVVRLSVTPSEFIRIPNTQQLGVLSHCAFGFVLGSLQVINA